MFALIVAAVRNKFLVRGKDYLPLNEKAYALVAALTNNYNVGQPFYYLTHPLGAITYLLQVCGGYLTFS